MKRPWIWAIVAVNLVILLALVFIYPHLMVSPGPLVPAHAELTTDCFACHAPMRGVASERCSTCHLQADIGVRTTKGLPVPTQKSKVAFHQKLLEKNCTACHTDHAGPLLTHRSRKPFSHALLNAAAAKQCKGCHEAPQTAMHRDMTGNCDSCHTQKAWKPATFAHDKMFLLDKDHNAKCVTCHLGNDYRKFTCYGCHEHQESRIRAKHLEEGIQNFNNCVECHRSAQEEPQGKGERGASGRRKD